MKIPSKPLILVADNKPVLKLPFKMADLDITEANTLQQVAENIRSTTLNVLVLNSKLAQQCTIDYVQRLKSQHTTLHIPVILLISKNQEQKIKKLTRGPDDYLIKPFVALDLIKRVKTLLNHKTDLKIKDTISIQDLYLNLNTRQATIAGKPVILTKMVFELLHFFITHKNQIYTREQLTKEVWAEKKRISTLTIDGHIRKLRKALKPYHYDQLVQTVHGIGYRLSIKNE